MPLQQFRTRFFHSVGARKATFWRVQQCWNSVERMLDPILKLSFGPLYRVTVFSNPWLEIKVKKQNRYQIQARRNFSRTKTGKTDEVKLPAELDVFSPMISLLMNRHFTTGRTHVLWIQIYPGVAKKVPGFVTEITKVLQYVLKIKTLDWSTETIRQIDHP